MITPCLWLHRSQLLRRAIIEIPVIDFRGRSSHLVADRLAKSASIRWNRFPHTINFNKIKCSLSERSQKKTSEKQNAAGVSVKEGRSQRLIQALRQKLYQISVHSVIKRRHLCWHIVNINHRIFLEHKTYHPFTGGSTKWLTEWNKSVLTGWSAWWMISNKLIMQPLNLFKGKSSIL